MQYYLHPVLPNAVLRTLIFYKQEIPPGSRSGRQQCQGSIIFYVLAGRGHTIVNGTRHRWAAGDMINLPILEEGIVYQHFNDDREAPVVMIGCEPNLVDVLGVDKGAGFEELDPAPEYTAQTRR